MGLDFVKATNTFVLWRLQNNSATATSITEIEIDWPIENDAIFNAILDGKVIWFGEDLLAPTNMTTWVGDDADRAVSGTHGLEFFFGTPASNSGYDLQISFDNGCTISSSN